MSPHVPLVARGIVTDIIRAKDNSSETGMTEEDVRAFTNAILALVQPAAGITLTTEEARLVIDTLYGEAEVYSFNGEIEDATRLRSAARKLEASA